MLVYKGLNFMKLLNFQLKRLLGYSCLTFNSFVFRPTNIRCD